VGTERRVQLALGQENLKLEILPEDIDRNKWNQIVTSFLDHSLMQSWEWGEAKRNFHVSRIIFKKGERIEGAAQCLIKTLPWVGKGLVWIPQGPVYRKDDSEDATETFDAILSELKGHFVKQQGMMLQIAPNVVTQQELIGILTNNNFQKSKITLSSVNTFYLDLTRSLEEIRNGFHSKWRNCLNQAEKRYNITVRSDSSQQSLQSFWDIYQEMLQRKQFDAGLDFEFVLALQNLYQGSEAVHEVTARSQMKIFLASEKDMLSAGVVALAFGRNCFYFLGATSDAGLKNQASYKIQWEIIKWAKQTGLECYDLYGADAVNNKGVYLFKERMGGKLVGLVGDWECCSNPILAKVINVAIAWKT